MKHAELSASGAERWLACPGSVNASRGLEDVTSDAAREGTLAHYVVELSLERRKSMRHLVGYTFPEHEDAGPVTDEMVEGAEMMAQVVEKACGGDWSKVLIEQRLQYPEREDMWGTADVVVTARTLTVIDYKFGRRAVEVAGNPQLAYYALAANAAHAKRRAKVKTIIVQPRARHEDGPIREYVISRTELVGWADRFARGIVAAHAEDAPRIPGDHCTFCPYLSQCPEHRKHIAAAGLSVLTPVEVESAPRQPSLPQSAEELARALDVIPMAEAYIKALRAEALRRVENGETIPGYKPVRSVTRRRWIDEAAALEALVAQGIDADQATETKIKSPAKIERLLKGKAGKAFTAEHAEKPRGAIQVAPESDRRERVNLGIDVFEAIEDDEPVAGLELLE